MKLSLKLIENSKNTKEQKVLISHNRMRKKEI